MWFLNLVREKSHFIETMGLDAAQRAQEAGASSYYSDGKDIIEKRPDGSVKRVASKMERAA